MDEVPHPLRTWGSTLKLNLSREKEIAGVHELGIRSRSRVKVMILCFYKWGDLNLDPR